MVLVLCSVNPEKFGQFVSYQKTITLAHHKFAGERWVIYNSSYRHQASDAKFLDWGQMDEHLWNEIFTGESKGHCYLQYICFSEMHSHVECPQTLEAHLLPTQSPRSAGRQAVHWQDCHLFNNCKKNRCTFQPCKFTHACSECWGGHPCPSLKRKKTAATLGRELDTEINNSV